MADDKAQPLGEVIKDLMDNVISKRQQHSVQLAEVWAKLLPEELSGHCNITEFSSGVLKVKTDGAVYQYELRLCKKALVKELNRALAGVRVRDIKIEM